MLRTVDCWGCGRRRSTRRRKLRVVSSNRVRKVSQRALGDSGTPSLGQRAGAAKSPGLFSCPYSPECVEGEFSELLMNRLERLSRPTPKDFSGRGIPPLRVLSRRLPAAARGGLVRDIPALRVDEVGDAAGAPEPGGGELLAVVEPLYPGVAVRGGVVDYYALAIAVEASNDQKVPVAGRNGRPVELPTPPRYAREHRHALGDPALHLSERRETVDGSLEAEGRSVRRVERPVAVAPVDVVVGSVGDRRDGLVQVTVAGLARPIGHHHRE